MGIVLPSRDTLGVGLRALALLLCPGLLSAAGFPPGTQTQPLLMVHGASNPPGSGDYISSTAGLNGFYSYFIEVPPGLSSLQVEIYDPDVRQGPDAEEQPGGLPVIRDQTRSTGTTMTFTLLNPAGATVATQVASAASPAGSHATWWTFATPASPAAGHWELRADANAGSNVAGYGIRARGFDGSGEVDLNVYIHSYLGYQLHAAGQRDYLVHPYVTGHCSLRLRDFDNDDNTSNPSEIVVSSPLPAPASQTFNVLSVNNAWATNDTSAATFFDDFSVLRPGIWNALIAPRPIGTGSTNEGQVYFASPLDVGGSTPPSAQPQSNSWRIYLPMLDGSEPVKPSVYQRLFHESGPNPPVVGQSSTYRVSIRVDNPTSRAIVFSGPSNRVTAFVPGGGAVYGGGALVSQGTVDAQPAVGASGQLIWNPGTLVAGGEADLTYLVSVTPAASGRLVVTGTPASNGTLATYLDETGNAAQSRATYTWGPLCELAVSTGGAPVPTPATLAMVSAVRGAQGEVRIEWATGVEVGVVGWEVLDGSQRRLPVGGQLAARGDSLGSTQYQIVVELSDEQFHLRSVDADGRTQLHGPFRVGFSNGVVPAPAPLPWSGIRAEAERQAAIRLAQARGAAEVVQLRVRASGIQVIEYEQLQALGADFLDVPVEQIAVRHASAPWPRRVRSRDDRFNAGDRIEFLAEARPGLVTDYVVYELLRDATAALEMPMAEPVAGPVDELQSVRQRAQLAEQNGFGFSSPLADPFFMARLSGARGQTVSRSFLLATPHIDTTAEATLLAQLWGGLDDPAISDEHAYALRVNGVLVQQDRFEGLQAESVAAPLSTLQWDSELQQVELSMTVDRTAFGVIHAESLGIEYSAAPIAVDGRLDFVAHPSQGDDPAVPQAERIFRDGVESAALMIPLDCEGVDATSLCWSVTVAGLATDALAYRQTTDGAMAEVGLAEGRVLDQKLADARWFVADGNGWHRPELVLTRPQPAAVSGADLLIISHPDFAGSMTPLLSLRQAQGLSVQVATTESIYALGGGQPGPAAIKAFIAESFAAGTRYVLLVGADSYDSAGYLGSGSIGFVPAPFLPLHPVVRFGAADAWYVDLDDDGGPDLALGRWPVRTVAELQTLLDKTLAMDGRVAGEALFVADDRDVSGFSFDDAQRALSARLGGDWAVEHVSLDDRSVAEVNALIIDRMRQGLGMLHFFGHSSPTAWTSPAPGILPPQQLFGGALSDAERPSLLVQWGCWNSYHVVPEFNTLAHGWLLGPGGAGVVIGAASITESENDRQLAERLLSALGQHERIGDALLAAKQSLALGNPRLVDVLMGTTLLGDPTLRLRP